MQQQDEAVVLGETFDRWFYLHCFWHRCQIQRLWSFCTGTGRVQTIYYSYIWAHASVCVQLNSSTCKSVNNISTVSRLQALIWLFPECSVSMLFHLTLLRALIMRWWANKLVHTSARYLNKHTNQCSSSQITKRPTKPTCLDGCVTQDAHMYSRKVMRFSTRQV